MLCLVARVFALPANTVLRARLIIIIMAGGLFPWALVLETALLIGRFWGGLAPSRGPLAHRLHPLHITMVRDWILGLHFKFPLAFFTQTKVME